MAADLDAVAHGLGVHSDHGIVEELSTAISALEGLGEGVRGQMGHLGLSVPEAVDALDGAWWSIRWACDALRTVRAAAEDHVRGGL